MKQNKKMKLDGLNVKSFVTTLEEKKIQTINGGRDILITVVVKTVDPGCSSDYHTCHTHLNTEACTWEKGCDTKDLLCGTIIRL